MLSRPSLDEVRQWRAAVDDALQSALPNLPPQALTLVELGIHHEQQHQELFLTDILATLRRESARAGLWIARSGALPCRRAIDVDRRAGRGGRDWRSRYGFAFDCERPRHQALLRPHRIADRCVTNGEWMQFIDDGGYRTATLWLSDGWDWLQREAIERPHYWHGDGTHFTLAGRREIDRAAPVAHVSHYEADAYARWAGRAAADRSRMGSGLRLRRSLARPPARSRRAGPAEPGGGPFGDVWQWTGSAYLPHPGFKPEEGTVGEYNGKFMSGQMVLKGASCATPRGHSRASYRNFFPPAARWQFTGVRLAQDA